MIYGWSVISETLFLNFFIKNDPFSGLANYTLAILNILFLNVDGDSKDISRLKDKTPIFFFG